MSAAWTPWSVSGRISAIAGVSSAAPCRSAPKARSGSAPFPTFSETAPVGAAAAGLFLNAAVRLVTSLDPPALLSALLDIERGLGRIRGERWGPRLIDLDILWIEALTVDTPELSVPHPELRRRAFALRPLLDVAPSASDPRDGEPYGPILAGLRAETELMVREDAGSWACIDMPPTRW